MKKQIAEIIAEHKKLIAPVIADAFEASMRIALEMKEAGEAVDAKACALAATNNALMVLMIDDEDF